jgi:hypothetical protein
MSPKFPLGPMSIVREVKNNKVKTSDRAKVTYAGSNETNVRIEIRETSYRDNNAELREDLDGAEEKDAAG